MTQIKISNENGRAGYEKPFDEFIDLSNVLQKQLQQCGSDEEKKLAIINKLLADHRHHAVDHEHKDGKIGYAFAALVKTRQGRYFLSANLHLHHTDITRDCAEYRSISEARDAEGNKLQIEHLWFMGGREDFNFSNTPAGPRYTPCGSCLDAIYGNRRHLHPGTIIHMLPLNDGTLHLKPGDPDDKREMKELKPNEVFSRNIWQLLPHVFYPLEDHKDTKKEVIREGYKWLQDPNGWVAIEDALREKQERQALAELKTLEAHHYKPEKRLRSISKLLMKTARDYYQDSDNKPHTLTIAIVRASDGKYYMGKYSRDGETPASPSAEFEAAGAMINASSKKRLTDIFVVTFDQKELEAINKSDKGEEVFIGMLDGAKRELAKKFSARPGRLQKDAPKDFFGEVVETGCGNIHVFLPYDINKHKFNAKEDMISFKVKDLLPSGFENPKAQAMSK